MTYLKIAACPSVQEGFITDAYEVVNLHQSDLTNIGAVVSSVEHIETAVEKVKNSGFGVPVFLALQPNEAVPAAVLPELSGVIQLGLGSRHYYGKQIAAAADEYAAQLAPPFFNALKNYTKRGYAAFDCPGHQGGQFFAKHPAGREFFHFFGENLFRADLCNADVRLGDLLIHEGPACAAQKHAAKVYHADKTYFVLNGTSTANKVVTSALLAKDDLVLFDRNNHKSIHLGALMICGARPVYLQTARNPYGFIGGIDAACFDEDYIRAEIRKVAPERTNAERPFRLAVIQLGTYDGTIYNARQVVDRIGHLCDYILFDSAWVGYEQFIPMMRDCSPLLLELNENDPGIIVTQSVHKQQSGFSQTSQIHKKDSHIKGQKRYCNHKRFNNAFMMHASTSPFYPMFAALDVNAKMHEGEAGRKLWRDCVRVGVEARKLMLDTCKMIRPFVPETVDGKPWQSYETETICDDLRFFRFEPDAKWHSFEGYAENQYFVDPCKLLLTTPGINVQTGAYEDFGVPATILANFLRDNGIVPEKCDLNSILFLLTPSENLAKLQHLTALIARFERHIENDSLMCDVLPSVYARYEDYYRGYTIRRLCREMHEFYKRNDMKNLQKAMFRADGWPRQAMSAYDAQQALIRNEVHLVRLSEIAGKVAAEGALPYPPGVLCTVPGEVWGGAVQQYFLALEEGINSLPGFEPEIQGVYLQEQEDGSRRAFGYAVNTEQA